MQPLTRYYYRIRAVNAAGLSDYSGVVDATTPAGPPAAPQNLVATAASTTQIDLSWSAIATASGVLVERSPNGSDGWSQVASLPGSATTYSDPSLTPNTRYFYRIRAVNASGAGPFSTVADATTPDAPPAAPARLTATPTTPSQVVLTWVDLSTNESGFQLERGSSATGTFTKLADLPATTTTYTDNGLADATAYCYRVRALNAAGASAYTEAVCVTTPLAPPAEPGGLTAQVQDYDQIRLAWAAVSPKALTVSIERAASPGGPFAEIKQVPAPTTSYVDPNLTEFTTYYYRIRAINAAGNSAYSNVASARISEVVIAVAEALDAHTDLVVSNRTLHVSTDWLVPATATLQLRTTAGQPVLTDHRTVRPADRWQYELAPIPAGVYIIQIESDGRTLAKRIVLP